MRARGLVLRFVLSLGVLLGGLVFVGVSPAFAGQAYVVGGSFGGQGTGDGLFEGPVGVAVSETGGSAGDVYVVDRGNSRVEQFSSAGVFVAAWGWGVSDGAAKAEVCTSSCEVGVTGEGEGQLNVPEGVAVDNSTSPLDPSAGDVYVTSTVDSTIEKFSAAGVYLGRLTEADGTPFAGLVAIAVDGSGDLWVYQSNGAVQELNDTGGFVAGFNTGRATASGLALDSSNDIYLTFGCHCLGKYNSKFEQLAQSETEPIEPVTALAVDPSTSDLFVDQGSRIEQWYGPFGEPYSTPLQTFADEGSEAISESNGIAVNGASGTVYASESGADKIDVFTSVLLPTVSVEAASSVEKAGGEVVATLNGSVNPEGTTVTSCKFEYGTSTSYGQSISCSELPGSGTSPVQVHSALKGLQGGVTYDYRLVTEDGGHSSVGPNEVFGTPAAVDALTTAGASGITQHAVTLNGSLTPDGLPVSACEFEYGSSESYGQSVPCVQTQQQIGEGSVPVSVSAQIEGLQPNTTYHYRLTATNAYGSSPGQDETFLTTAPPSIENVSFSEVGSDDAKVTAQINGNGAPTSYTIEYGTTTAYGATTPPTNLTSIRGALTVSTVLTGLAPNTLYHFRINAINSEGATQAADTTLTTFVSTAENLPDDRTFEMVTPVENYDADIYVPEAQGKLDEAQTGAFASEQPFQTSTDGDAVTYVGQVTTGGNSYQGPGYGNQYLAKRSPTGGWTQLNISPVDHTGAVYEAFSSDLSTGILTSFEEPTLAPNAPGGDYEVIYSRNNSDGSYRPIFTTKPPHRLPGEPIAGRPEFGTFNPGQKRVMSLFYAGSSANLEHLLFEANDALTPDAVDGGKEENNLYDSVGDELHVVNVLPGATVSDPNASFGSQSQDGGNPPDFSHVISDDGTHIFWTDLNTGGLYVRENDASTVAVSAGLAPASFWTATPDGTYAFYTEGGGLYRFDTQDEIRIEIAGPSAGVQGVIGTSDNGEYVYFVAKEALSTVKNANGEEAQAGEDNLYVYEPDPNDPGQHSTTFIATLIPNDNENHETGKGAFGDWRPDLGHRTAEVTPSGHSLVFMSKRSLTGYQANGSEGPIFEVFVYDVGANRLSCVSCNPSGERPPYLETFVGGYLPASESRTYMPLWIAESGGGVRVFFDSFEPLVPADTDGKQDVYEWEQEGVGSCPARSVKGCVYMLSGGTGSDASYLIDASATGDDVFIATRTRLVSEDGNDHFNLFDARVGGVQPITAPLCSGTGCQGVPPAPPIFATPSSVTFNGVGNFPVAPVTPVVKVKSKALTRAQKLSRALKACESKHGRQKRMVCESRARKRYGPKADRSNKRRVGRGDRNKGRGGR